MKRRLVFTRDDKVQQVQFKKGEEAGLMLDSGDIVVSSEHMTLGHVQARMKTGSVAEVSSDEVTEPAATPVAKKTRGRRRTE